ncbi:probable LRR receptor-like serine/threonine-protein kinase At1g51820 [Cynara cardunculus var. scolymus]|uniref:probable LRR receptor-like serine/threonine-protein kinase At1g51820 n=1 Tax=Cynara cardunculus var. scolymus TaxID=59895 RepID=UPI000D62C0CB|nr:probable LRR receptor-like serine/threonine-protein kinase At1g51820 [Cynara cardunculus var. scolymus]
MAKHLKLLTILLLALFTFSVSGDDVFWSVNCGATDFYTDENSISWAPDDSLVSNGLARVVQSSNSISPVLDSLRVFTSRKKNCYSTPVTKGEKLLVRASFNYGNYDRLSSPPKFDLHFDGNFWTTVETTASGAQVYEATYVTKGDAASVCVAQTNPNQFPFISSLEFRSVGLEVYNLADDNRALFLIERLSFGASDTLRYPNDLYDRIWVPLSGSGAVTSEAILFNTSISDNPPQGILESAIVGASTTTSLIFATVQPSNDLLYINMYFSEVLDTTETRIFRVYESSPSVSRPLTATISPAFGGVSERIFTNYTTNSAMNLSLMATAESDLPPLINAIEAFNISDVLTDGTDSNDVATLMLLQTTFDVLAQWSGDPCLPAPYSWDWLNCSNDATPRVTSLHLDSFDLSGSLPDISSMDALETIDLHNNSLTGTIPDYLGTMPKLKELNLANNSFSGPIPTSVSKNNKLKLTVTGNPSLCTSGKSCSSSSGGTTSKKKSSNMPIILGTTIPVFFLIWIVAGIFIILRKKRTNNVNVLAVAGGEENGKPNGLHTVGEQMMNGIGQNTVQQTFGSPSPLLDTSGQTSDLHDQTTAH